MTIAKSTEITNLDASPRVQNDVANSGGRERKCAGNFEVETTDIDDNDELRLCRLPSNAVVDKIEVMNDDLDSGSPTLAFNVGVFEAGGEGIKDEDAYASAMTTFQAATTAWVEVQNEARDIAKVGQKLWQDAGDSADPGGHYEIGIKFSNVAATAVAGTVAYRVTYTVD